MSSSPNSNASSSDLYSPSDNPELVPAHPARTPTLVKEQPTEDYIALHLSHPNDQHGEPTAEGEQGTVEPGRRKPDTRDPSVYNTPNGDNNNGYHKRKRDEEEETSQDPLGQLSVSPLPGDAQHFGNFGRNGSPPQKRQLILEYWSRINRSDLQGDPTHSEGIRGHSRSSNLPDEIWQHIFSFVPPVFLGRLLRVNRVFHACLTMAIGEQSDQANSASNAVRPVSANFVWAASRKRFAPGLPKPLRGLQELQMWRLLRGRPCQMCGETKIQNFATSSESPLESGPGDKGVRVLWPFGIRACGSCLQNCSEKVYLISAWAPCKYMTLTDFFVRSRRCMFPRTVPTFFSLHCLSPL